MNRHPHHNAWYGFSALEGPAIAHGAWACLNFGGWIDSSIGRIELPKMGGVPDMPLYLVGAVWAGKLQMAGQSQGGHGTWFYTDGDWYQLSPVSFGMSPCAFSQDGTQFYAVTHGGGGFWRDTAGDGGLHPFNANVYVDGLRAVIPPTNKLVLGNLTQYNATYNLYECIDFENGLAVGQGADGLVVWYQGLRYLIEPGGTFFIRAMYDGHNLALATVKQTERQLVNWFLTVPELTSGAFPISGAADPIPAINKPCWVAWFEFQQAPSRVPPGNAMIAIRWPLQSETILRLDGSLFARWAAGGSVEEIEQKAASSDVPVLAYWDGRNWPRYPTLRPQDWLGLFGYCYADETMAVFEANLRHLVQAVPASYPHIAIVCQAFTSNASLTTNLQGLVAVYARIARDNPRVTFLAPFSDQGRATGLQDHPELVPSWQELFSGVTGTPDTGGGPVPNCGEPGHVPDWEKRMPNRVDVVQQMKDQYPAEWDAMNTAGDTTLIRRIAWALYQEDQRWGLNGKRGGPVLSEDVIAFLNETVANGSRPGMEAADVIISHGAPYAQPGWLDITCSTTQGGSGGLWIKPVAVDPEPPEPTPGAIEVLIHRYDATASRSDPQGWAINYEIASERPVLWIEVGLEGDGEPAIELMFKNEPRIDGRYQRGIFIKPTVEGSWYPRVRARDDQGHEATADGATPVQVGP